MFRALFSSAAVLVALVVGSLWVAARYFAPLAGGSFELVRILDSVPQLLFMVYLPLAAYNLYRHLNGLPRLFDGFLFYVGASIGGLNFGTAAYALIRVAAFGAALDPLALVFDLLIGFVFVGWAYVEEKSRAF